MKHPGHPPRQHKQPAPPWWAPPKTRREAVKQSYLETRPEYLPVKRQIHQQIAASTKRQNEVGGWWNEYLQKVQGATDATQKAYADAAQQTQGMIGQASALDSQNTARLNQEAAASAAARGVEAPTQAITARANAAQAQRNFAGDVQGAATAARGANQFAYLTEQGRIGAGQRVKSMQDEGARRHGYEKDLLSAKKEQGAQAVKNFNSTRARYREELLKKRAFGIEQQKAGQEARESAIERGEDRRENQRKAHLEAEDNRRANEAQHNENAEQHNQNRKAKNEGKHGGKTRSERNDVREGRENALSTVHSFIQAHGYPKNPAARAELEREVAKESEVSPAEARWAVARYLKRHPPKPDLNVPQPFP
jgi:hypothetical protein